MFVRWDELRVETEEGRRLPGYRDAATVRTFDAPEALDVRFYEVHARSVLNRVPKASRMPFRWTINPYRGCTHACQFCIRGDTPILMADGRAVPIADLTTGDRIYGTVREGAYRRYAITEVRDHWETRKPASRVTLEDGTELVASGDHRFLTRRGWKHVTGTESGRARRPHLTLNDELLGTGSFESPPAHSPDYRRGYLCGMVRGDGHLASYAYPRPGRAGEIHQFRLALVDLDALRRTRAFLADQGIATGEFLFQRAGAVGSSKPVHGIRTARRLHVAHIREVVEWPRQASDDWCHGFLAGIFDAEGGRSGGVLRISNTDPAIIDWITWCLSRLQFDHVVEHPPRTNGLKVVRLRGGLQAHLRLFHLVDPAIARKRVNPGRSTPN